jgi:protein-disulfide isomerase
VKNKIIIISLVLLTLIAVFIAAAKVYQSNQTAELDKVAREYLKKFVPDHAAKLGPDNPKVYLVEFLDPECETCRAFYPLVKSILDETEGKVQLVVRYAPFHQNSKFAIKILEASKKQGKYWETLEVLFRYQPQWGDHHDPRPDLIWNYLPEAGVDVERIRNDMNDPAFDELIAQEVKDLKELRVTGTPSFFVNGKPLEVFSYEGLKDLINSELAK